MNALTTNGRRGAAVLFLSGVALVATIATAAAFSGRDAGDVELTPTAPIVTPAPVVTPAPSEAPVLTPAPVPTETPDETAAPAPTDVPEETPAPTDNPEPTDGGTDAMPIKVDLENATGNDVYVDVVDYGETLVDAVSGTPGDGMSVEPYTLQVENIDERTLRLTWIDYAIDNALTLYVYGDGDRIVLIQPEPGQAVDSMGFDRELILTFDHAVSAGAIEAFLQDGMDTPGVE
jgi:hypothetical protein